MHHMSRAAALVDEIANELASWPGVRIERVSEDAALVHYEDLQLGALDRERGVVELRFSELERDELIEHGDAEPSDSMPEGVSHGVHGPSDVTAVLELFDRRYRNLRGEDDPYSTQDPSGSSPDA
jgi:luciferase-like monooxygenase